MENNTIRLYTLSEAKAEMKRRNKAKAKKHKREMLKQKLIGLLFYITGIFFLTKGEITCAIMCCTFGTYVFARDKFILF